MEDYDGFLITVEGIDKSGKSTVVSKLQEEIELILEEKDIDRNVITTTEPCDGEYGYSNEFGELVRNKLKDNKVSQLSLFHAFMSDHHQHVKDVVMPALNRGDIVISDRYMDSRMVYQAISLGDMIEGDTLQWIRDLHTEPGKTPIPDITLYIRISVEESMKRKGKSDGEIFEYDSFQEKVKENYDALSKKEERFITIDGEQSKTDVLNDVSERITNISEQF